MNHLIEMVEQPRRGAYRGLIFMHRSAPHIAAILPVTGRVIHRQINYFGRGVARQFHFPARQMIDRAMEFAV
jgi:predicted ATPase